MFCQSCGKEIDENIKFCPNCGECISTKEISKNKKNVIVVLLTSLLIIAGLLLALVAQQNNKTEILTIKSNNLTLEQAFNLYPKFIGSRVLVKVKANSFRVKLNKQIMNAAQYKVERNLIKNHHYDATVIQISKDRFMVYIPDEFDRKEIEKVLITKPILEFKKRIPNKNEERTYETVNLTSADLKSATLEQVNHNNYIINIKFNEQGTHKFAKLTKELVGEELGIFINDELISSPKILEPITGGTAQISGGYNGFEYEEAKALVNVLDTDIVPIRLKIVDIK